MDSNSNSSMTHSPIDTVQCETILRRRIIVSILFPSVPAILTTAWILLCAYVGRNDTSHSDGALAGIALFVVATYAGMFLTLVCSLVRIILASSVLFITSAQKGKFALLFNLLFFPACVLLHMYFRTVLAWVTPRYC